MEGLFRILQRARGDKATLPRESVNNRTKARNICRNARLATKHGESVMWHSNCREAYGVRKYGPLAGAEELNCAVWFGVSHRFGVYLSLGLDTLRPASQQYKDSVKMPDACICTLYVLAVSYNVLLEDTCTNTLDDSTFEQIVVFRGGSCPSAG